MNSVKVRFPPSPTGYCHVGTARMAVLNFLFAKKHGGTILFRSEDTDRERSTKEFEDDIVNQLEWLGLAWDEFYRSTEMVERHKEAMQQLIHEGTAYVSEEESKKDPGQKVRVVRLRNTGKTVSFTDAIRGDITVDTTDLGDFVIGRAIDDPLYHLAVVVDDAKDGITHVIRGEDHISNTPRQILIQEALQYPRPLYAHFPLHLAADKTKLSKRKGDVAVRSYREKGYIPEALLNYLAILGWTPPSGREVLSIEEMIAEFDLKDLHKSAAVFDLEKLRWFNRQYVERMNDEDFAHSAHPFLLAALKERGLPSDENLQRAVMPLLLERTSVADDIKEIAREGQLDFFFIRPTLDPAKIPDKRTAGEVARKHLTFAEGALIALSKSDWSETRIKDALWAYATENGRGAVLWPLRYALSGQEKSPDPFTIAAIIGREETLSRIRGALEAIQI